MLRRPVDRVRAGRRPKCPARSPYQRSSSDYASDDMEKSADCFAVSEETRTGKKPVPVVNMASDERKSLGLRIG